MSCIKDNEIHNKRRRLTGIDRSEGFVKIPACLRTTSQHHKEGPASVS